MNLKTIPVLYNPVGQAPRVDLVKEIPLSRPLSVYIEPCNSCNFKCLFCPESFADYKEKSGGMYMLSLDDFKKIAFQVKEVAPVRLINFYMLGEPFINKHLTTFIRLAKEMGLAETVIVTTNGSLVRPDKYRAICDSGLDFLRVSIYGGTEELHRKRTQSQFPLSKIRDNIAGLKEFRDTEGYESPFIYAKMITASVKEGAAFAALFGPHTDKLQVESAAHNWMELPDKNLAQLDDAEMFSQKYFSNRKEVCPFPFYMSIIHSDLNVSVCGVDWAKLAVVGNLRNETLAEVWRGPRLREFQLKHLQRKRCELAACANCTYIHTATDNIDALDEKAIDRRHNK